MTATDEKTDRTEYTGKPLCVDRYSAIRPVRQAAERVRHDREELPEIPPEKPPVLTGRQLPASDKTPKAPPAAKEQSEAAERSASPRITTNSSLTLWLAAVCGLTAGLVSAEGAEAGGNVLLCTEGSFLSLFLSRLAYGGVFLLIEYLLGFFALGEWAVWAVPLLCGLGTGWSAAGAVGQAGTLPLVIPAAATLLAVIAGARHSGAFSAQLLRVVSGSRTGIVLTADAAGSYTLRFVGCLAAVAAAALFEAAVKL